MEGTAVGCAEYAEFAYRYGRVRDPLRRRIAKGHLKARQLPPDQAVPTL